MMQVSSFVVIDNSYTQITGIALCMLRQFLFVYLDVIVNENLALCKHEEGVLNAGDLAPQHSAVLQAVKKYNGQQAL